MKTLINLAGEIIGSILADHREGDKLEAMEVMEAACRYVLVAAFDAERNSK